MTREKNICFLEGNRVVVELGEVDQVDGDPDDAGVERSELRDDDDGDPVLFFCSDTPVRQSDLDEAVRTGISDDDKQRWIHDTESRIRYHKMLPDKH